MDGTTPLGIGHTPMTKLLPLLLALVLTADTWAPAECLTDSECEGIPLIQGMQDAEQAADNEVI